jgi:hypothetical protein
VPVVASGVRHQKAIKKRIKSYKHRLDAYFNKIPLTQNQDSQKNPRKNQVAGDSGLCSNVVSTNEHSNYKTKHKGVMQKTERVKRQGERILC